MLSVKRNQRTTEIHSKTFMQDNITTKPEVEAVSPVSLFPRVTLFCTCNKNTVNICFFLSVMKQNKPEHSHLLLPLCQVPLACEADKKSDKSKTKIILISLISDFAFLKSIVSPSK